MHCGLCKRSRPHLGSGFDSIPPGSSSSSSSSSRVEQQQQHQHDLRMDEGGSITAMRTCDIQTQLRAAGTSWWPPVSPAGSGSVLFLSCVDSISYQKASCGCEIRARPRQGSREGERVCEDASQSPAKAQPKHREATRTKSIHSQEAEEKSKPHFPNRFLHKEWRGIGGLGPVQPRKSCSYTRDVVSISDRIYQRSRACSAK